MSEEEEKSWRKSEAKKLLAQDIIDGTIPEDMDWKDVFQWRPEYTLSNYRLFKSRLDGLRNQISAAKKRAKRDEKALSVDRKLYPACLHDDQGALRWDGSAAQSWLKNDVAENKHKEMKPSELYLERPCYQAFSLDVFRGHIHQEVRLQKYCTWRSDKGKPKANEWM